MTTPNPYHGFRFPAEMIEHAVWLYHCFSLSLRDVELILAVSLRSHVLFNWAAPGYLMLFPLARPRYRPQAAG